MSNSIGTQFVVTSFGESHGRCVGVVIDGCPAGLPIGLDEIQAEVDRRKPQSSAGGTGRREEDRVEALSGIFNGRSTGAPICLLAWNKDADSSAYSEIISRPRPGHADYTAFLKYGKYNDFRGGGRFSGRITAGFVMAGAIAGKLLAQRGIAIIAHTVQIGDVKSDPHPSHITRRYIDKTPVRCADPAAAKKMMAAIQAVQKDADSIGGTVEALALNVPGGLGEPVFDTLEGELSKAFFAIPAARGVEFGAGFGAAAMRGSQHNDLFSVKNKKIVTLTNHAGGISGGLSNGMPIIARVAFKPTASIGKSQQTVNLKTGKKVDLAVKGRHDSCIVPRAVPVVEAMMSLVLCDFALRAGYIGRIIS
ncbi:MAG: chorismate synthase [Dehalococcoidia bacterium]|nr:chorismate synthase [Dehalococcoidia bacterium]